MAGRVRAAGWRTASPRRARAGLDVNPRRPWRVIDLLVLMDALDVAIASGGRFPRGVVKDWQRVRDRLRADVEASVSEERG